MLWATSWYDAQKSYNLASISVLSRIIMPDPSAFYHDTLTRSLSLFGLPYCSKVGIHWAPLGWGYANYLCECFLYLPCSLVIDLPSIFQPNQSNNHTWDFTQSASFIAQILKWEQYIEFIDFPTRTYLKWFFRLVHTHEQHPYDFISQILNTQSVP